MSPEKSLASNQRIEGAFALVLSSLLENKKVLRCLADIEDELLDENRVAALLGVSTKTVRRLREEGKWRMVKGPTGKYQMTRKQFREQRDILLQMSRRGY